MIILCPHCGQQLPQPLKSGLTSCLNCRRVSDSCHENVLLSAAWMVRRKDISNVEHLMHYGYRRSDAEFVIKHVSDELLNHEEFSKLLKKTDLSLLLDS